MLQVADLLNKNMFPDFRVAAGSKGLIREITSVSVLDAPDVDRWMRGGEFLIGSGYIFKDDPTEFTHFLDRVATKDIAAVGIKLDRFYHTLPSGIIDQANSLNLPLIEIPIDYRWTDIIENVTLFLLSEKNKDVLRQDIEVVQSLQMLNDEEDIKNLIALIAKDLERHMVVKAPRIHIFNHFACNDKESDNGTYLNVFDTPSLEEKPLPKKGIILANLSLKMLDKPSWVACYRIDGEPNVEVALILKDNEHYPSIRQNNSMWRIVSLLRLAQLDAVLTLNQHDIEKERFLESLCLGLYNDLDIITHKANEMGLKLPSKAFVLMATPANDKSTTKEQWKPQSSLSYRLGNIWVTIHSHKDRAFDWTATAKNNNYWISLGQNVESLLNLNKSYLQAKQTLNWIKEFKCEPGAYQHGDLSLHALLANLDSIPEAKELHQRYWMPLMEVKARSKNTISLDIVAKTLIQVDFNVKEMAKILHVHYNTARKYVKEIEHTLNIKMDSREHKIGLELAYYIDSYKK